MPFTVGEILGLGKVVPYPDAAMNTPDEGHAIRALRAGFCLAPGGATPCAGCPDALGPQ